MKQSLLDRLNDLTKRLSEISALLCQSNVVENMDEYRKLTREHAEIEPVVHLYQAFLRAQQDWLTAQELAQDPEQKEWAQEEMKLSRASQDQLETQIQAALLPQDPNDNRNIFMEIRAGTGGDESALFAGALFRLYSRYAERRHWLTEIISHSDGEMGGFKEIVIRIEGQGAYSRLKYESGGHRVQRVPETETQGRIHTSACTVAVLPEPDELAEITLNPAELRIDTFRASGAGGQHINKTDSAVRITHLPSGLVVECQDGRSQHKNKAQAMSVLAARLKDKQEREQHAKEAATRKSLIGSGDRSERIRTYNFPQGRVTDHRIHLTLYKLEYYMDGDIDEMTNALIAERQAELLAGLNESSP